MITALKIIIVIFSAFAALGLLCAVRIGRRATWAAPPADPYFHPFGEMPALTPEQLARLAPRDFSDNPLRRSFAARAVILEPDETADVYGRAIKNSAGLALRPADADGGGHVPSWLAPISRFLKREQHHG
jgi:hypothetical protein